MRRWFAALCITLLLSLAFTPALACAAVGNAGPAAAGADVTAPCPMHANTAPGEAPDTTPAPGEHGKAAAKAACCCPTPVAASAAAPAAFVQETRRLRPALEDARFSSHTPERATPPPKVV